MQFYDTLSPHSKKNSRVLRRVDLSVFTRLAHISLSTYHALGGVSRTLRPTNLRHCYRHGWLGTLLNAMATFENDTLFSERNKVHGHWNASWKNNRDTCSDLPQWSIIIWKLEPFGIWAWQNITMVELCQTGQNWAITIKWRGKERNSLICSSEISLNQYDDPW